jgi:PPOX class probable F420-dependent enzyme
MDQDEAWARVSAARIGRMATVTPEQRPHVVPFVFVLVERGPARVAYWAVDRKPKRSTDLKRIRNLEANPAVEFVVDGYDEDWERVWWVRCSGTGRVVDDDSERRSALRALEEKYPRYAHDQPDGPVVAIDIETLDNWEGADRRGQSSTAS